jgi:hypothetical protein
MGLTNITQVAGRLVDQMRTFGGAVTFVSDTWSGGDLPWRNVVAIENAFIAAAQTAQQVEVEAGINPTKAQSTIAEFGGPATLAEFAAGVQQQRDLTRDWADLVLAELHKLPPALLVYMHSEPLYRQTRFITNLPEATGLVLKNSPELAALRAELVALGAIAD